LHHIIENYHRLDDVTVFTQGKPFDHCPNITDHIDTMLEEGMELPYLNLSQSHSATTIGVLSTSNHATTTNG
jgi:hypothetical protein